MKLNRHIVTKLCETAQEISLVKERLKLQLGRNAQAYTEARNGLNDALTHLAVVCDTTIDRMVRGRVDEIVANFTEDAGCVFCGHHHHRGVLCLHPNCTCQD